MKTILVALAALLSLASCGGSGVDPKDARPIRTLVSFGDSLSDVGTYKVGTVASLGGGQYTVNGVGPHWVDRIAASLGLAKPCAAQTGLDGLASQGFSVPVTNHANCFAYAQGGARVTEPVGPGNKQLGGANAIIGQLTVPVVAQMQRHLATNGGTYSGDEIVFVYAGGNDVFINLGVLTSKISLGADASAASAASVQAMSAAGAQLAGYISDLVIGKGASRVVVINLPDVSVTPLGLSLPQPIRAAVADMVIAFNAQLQSGLANQDVAWVDAYASVRDQVARPAQYGLSNVIDPACDLSPGRNLLGSSLLCSPTNLIAGDTSRYLFADTVHPTPYGNQLLAEAISRQLASKGWQ